MKQLQRFKDEGFTVKCCYEAYYCGYNSQRTLSKNGFETDIIAPSSILRKTAKHAKTDRLDARLLAEQHANNMLQTVYIPTEEDEHDRSIIRTRSFFVDQRKALKQHTLSLCRIFGLDFKAETKAKEYWTKQHLTWLNLKLKTLKPEAKLNLEFLLMQYKQYNEAIDLYNEKINTLASSEKYKKKVNALLCFKGVQTLTAMTFITELGDIKRFAHPNSITSYVGIDLREYSSGGKEKRYGITKMGNKFLRTSAIESCQQMHIYRPVNKQLKARREGQDPELIEIAEKCRKRLYKRANHLLEAGKSSNKVKVAIAREFLGFIWAALNKVA